MPAAQRKAITDGQVFSIRVNGKEVKAKSSIDVADGARASVEIRYYSFLEDRKACPARRPEPGAAGAPSGCHL